MPPAAPVELDARVRPLAEHPALLARAAELLCLPALMPLTREDADKVTAHMGLVAFPPGTVMLREGDARRADYLLLVLDGEVRVDVRADADGPMTLSVLGPGSIVGEMAMLDGSPRSASCTAIGTVVAAGLSRQALERLLDQHPRAAARLLLGLAQCLAERLRALGQQLQIYARISVGPGGG